MARSSLPILLLGGLGLAAVAASNKKKAQTLPPQQTTKPKPSGGGGGGGGTAPPVHHDGDPQVVPTPQIDPCSYALDYRSTVGSTSKSFGFLPLGHFDSDAEAQSRALELAPGLSEPAGAGPGNWLLIRRCGDEQSSLGIVKSF